MPEIDAAIRATAATRVMAIKVTATMAATEIRAAADFSRPTSKVSNAAIEKALTVAATTVEVTTMVDGLASN